MPFLVTVEAHDLELVFLSPTVSASGRGGASVFLTLVLLLIQISMLFLLFLSFLVRGLTTSDRQKIGRLWCQRRRAFFDWVVVRVLGGENL